MHRYIPNCDWKFEIEAGLTCVAADRVNGAKWVAPGTRVFKGKILFVVLKFNPESICIMYANYNWFCKKHKQN